MNIDPLHDTALVGPSDRSFGFVFTAVFALIGLLPLWDGGAPRRWSIALSAAVLVLALAWPRALAPANRAWFRLGRLLHRVVNPLVMAALFYVAVTPFGLVRRAFRRGLSRSLRPDRDASTYWVADPETTVRMDQPF